MAIPRFARILGLFGIRFHAADANRKPITAIARKIRITERPTLESLEPRFLPSIAIQLDYSYDSNGFFIGHADR